jgi:hypothetical protein
VEVVFTPTSAGTRPGSLTVTSSDPSSPITVSLTGTALAPGAFTLTANGGSTASTTVTSGWPAGYNLSLTPQNGYTGAIILNCTPINPGQYASCSLLPSSITLNGNAAQASVATLNTVTSVATSQNRESPGGRSSIAVCRLPLGLMLYRRSRTTLAIALLSLVGLFASGCGSGGTLITADPNLRYTPPGVYKYQVTATSSTGVPLSQTVTLNLTVTAR